MTGFERIEAPQKGPQVSKPLRTSVLIADTFEGTRQSGGRVVSDKARLRWTGHGPTLRAVSRYRSVSMG